MSRQDTTYHVYRAQESLQDPRSEDDDVEKARQQHLFIALECLAKIQKVSDLDDYLEVHKLVQQALCHYLRDEKSKALDCVNQALATDFLKPSTKAA